MPIFYKGDVQSVSQVTGFDWTSQTAKEVTILNPDQTKTTYTGANVVVDDNVTGTIHVVHTMAQVGKHLMQAKLTVNTVIKFGPVTDFVVSNPLSA